MDTIENTNQLGNMMETTMKSVKEMLQTDTVAGEPITTPDGITLIPISQISVGFGGGGIELGKKRCTKTQPYGGGNATGVKVTPTGFLVVKDGVVRMVNVAPPASNTVDRLIDLVPQVMDRIDAFINNTGKEE